ncbi:hypothetical protein [Pseudoxanthomonas mexicana]|uniref:hypothetical protein n=1 Tax=Pseudoxanthomonas mexicana TaxID=128785 RepID=UPI0028A69233|nr:hypothetical protein [Pseudoxanthomonas mexicana]
MTDYRRTLIPGATYFFTVNLANRRRTRLVDHIDLLREAFRYTRQRHSFIIDAMVVLPTTCMPSGRCRRTMRTSRSAGDSSRPGFLATYRVANIAGPVA